MKKPFIVLWGFIAGVFLFSWIYLPALSKYQDLKVRQEGMDLQIKELEQKIADIQEERNLLKTDVSYLEKIIRDELGLVKPGEIVYKFVPDQDPKTVPVIQPMEDQMKAAYDAAKKAAPLQAVIVPAKKIETAVKVPAAPAVAAKAAAPAIRNPTSDPLYPRRETR